MYSYDTLEHVPYEDEYGDENEELYDALRTKIAMLSETYRHIIILFYYDGLSTKRISEKLSIPEGTVTWRLSEARRKLKKECVEMDKAALKPVKLTIRINGDGNYKDPISPFPHVYIQDALSQNILYHCYETPKTVEELARHCGVPAYYIEDCLQNSYTAKPCPRFLKENTKPILSSIPTRQTRIVTRQRGSSRRSSTALSSR